LYQNYLIKLLRVKQWYKNFIIFIGLVFGLELLSPENLIISILGFASLCLITSSYYIRNDINDIESDKLHPHKNKRPLAIGKVTISQAYILFFVILISGFILAFILDFWFGILMVLLFGNTELYNRFAKKIIFLDVFSIGINFIIRSISGILLINTPISPWIIIGIFFVSLMLGFMKRKTELITLKTTAKEHRISLKKYNLKSLNSALIISAVLVIFTYVLYTITGPFSDGRLIITIPLIAGIVIRQLHLSKINHKLIQENDYFKDKITIGLVILYSIILFIILYRFEWIMQLTNF